MRRPVVFTVLAAVVFLATQAIASTPKDPCGNGLGDLGGDFPIEKVYPNVKVKPGVVDRSSKAFVLWRSRTPPHIPDSAFNYHYYTPAQAQTSLRLSPASRGGPSRLSFEGGSPIRSEAGKQILQSRINQAAELLNIGTPADVSEAISTISQADPNWHLSSDLGALTSEKIAKLRQSEPFTEYRYFILEDGRVYAFTVEEERSIFARLHPYIKNTGDATIKGLHHAGLAALIETRTQKRGHIRVWDFGTLFIRRSGELQIQSYRISRASKLKPFPTIEFLQAEYPEIGPLSLSDVDF